MKQIKFIVNYIMHFISARHSGGFGVHSPYLFHFIKYILDDKNQYYLFNDIEAVRQNLLKDYQPIKIDDFGTGKNRTQTLAKIAKGSLKEPKYGQLFFKIIHRIKAKNVLELGTSLGITTAYLAGSSTNIKCVSIEGSKNIAAVAQQNFDMLNLSNIEIVCDDINKRLTQVIDGFKTLDFVFIDANHKLPEAYIYFEKCLPKINENSILVMDDIYWSDDMKKAWNMVKNHWCVTATFDLFDIGIVFFKPELNKKHYKIRY